MDWPAFSVSSLKFLLFSLATLTPRAGPSQDFFWALKNRTLVSWSVEHFEITYHAAKREQIVHNHVEVLVFVKIIDLKQILFLQPIGSAGLQVHFDVFSLKYEFMFYAFIDFQTRFKSIVKFNITGGQFITCLKGAFSVLIFFTEPGWRLLMRLQRTDPSLRSSPKSIWSFISPSLLPVTSSIQVTHCFALSGLNFAWDWKWKEVRTMQTFSATSQVFKMNSKLV